jgi:hypothetical protein
VFVVGEDVVKLYAERPSAQLDLLGYRSQDLVLPLVVAGERSPA